MMTIREYFEAEEHWEEEIELWKMVESENVDLKEWCEAHDVDYYAYDEKIGETIITLWAWDLCGE